MKLKVIGISFIFATAAMAAMYNGGSRQSGIDFSAGIPNAAFSNQFVSKVTDSTVSGTITTIGSQNGVNARAGTLAATTTNGGYSININATAAIGPGPSMEFVDTTAGVTVLTVYASTTGVLAGLQFSLDRLTLGGTFLDTRNAFIPRTAISNCQWIGIAAGTSITNLVTVAGAKTGDGVSVTFTNPLAEQVLISAWVSATNTVTIRAFNVDLLTTSVGLTNNLRVEVRSY